MAQISSRRAMVERLVNMTREDAASRRRCIETIDPIIRVGRRIYPYLSERELNDCASSALRVILSHKVEEPNQMTLITF